MNTLKREQRTFVSMRGLSGGEVGVRGFGVCGGGDFMACLSGA
jgi:hypothetical protein